MTTQFWLRTFWRMLMNSHYVEWLQTQGVPLFDAEDVYWQLSRGILSPATATPCYVKLSHDEAQNLLRKSGAYLVRYSSDPCEQVTEWWYIVCDRFEPNKLSSKTRQNINRGKRNCSVRRIDGEWLANNGYQCYQAAHSRYKNANLVEAEVFYKNTLKSSGGPFEYWGVFFEDHLAGYCQCIVEDNDIITNVTKYHPAFLKHRSAYALINYLINHYVVEIGKTLSNGNRSIAHDTNYQDVLINMGFRKQYCRLNVVYQLWLKFIIDIFFPLRKLIISLPNYGPIHKIQVLLLQEHLRKACQNL